MWNTFTTFVMKYWSPIWAFIQKVIPWLKKAEDEVDGITEKYSISRRKWLLIASSAALALYMIAMDPFSNTGLLINIPYGVALLMMIKIFLLIVVILSLFHFLMDIDLDRSHGDDKDLAEIAGRISTGAGYVLIARSIRFLAGSMIVLGVLIYCANPGQ